MRLPFVPLDRRHLSPFSFSALPRDSNSSFDGEFGLPLEGKCRSATLLRLARAVSPGGTSRLTSFVSPFIDFAIPFHKIHHPEFTIQVIENSSTLCKMDTLA